MTLFLLAMAILLVALAVMALVADVSDPYGERRDAERRNPKDQAHR